MTLFKKVEDKFKAIPDYYFLAAGIIFLIIQGLILTHLLENWIDIRLWDEAQYLGSGIKFFKELPASFWGPLYSLWYYILNIFSNDSINLYYLNYRLMTIIPAIILFIYLYRLTTNLILSFLFSYLFLISIINLPTWPKVSHFVLIIILIAFVFIIKTEDKKNKLILATITSIIAAYIRPEFILSFLIFFSVLLFLSIKKKLKPVRLIPVAISFIILILLFGFPYSAGRNLTAFGQAYDKNISLSERIENGEAKEYTDVIKDNFGNANSLLDIIINDSDKFFNHLWFNIERLPNLFFNYSELILPTRIIKIDFRFASIILLFLLSTIPFVLFLIRKNNSTNKNQNENLFLIIGISIIFILPELISLVLYLPRSHYLILLLPFFYTYLGPLAIFLKIKNRLAEIFIFLFFVFLSFLFLPDLSNYFNKPDFQNRKTIRFLKNLNITKEVNLLENEGGLHFFLEDNYNRIETDSMYKPLSSFLSNKKVNIIIATQKLNRVSILRNDSAWFGFLNNPESLGYKKIIVDREINAYLKKDLLKTN